MALRTTNVVGPGAAAKEVSLKWGQLSFLNESVSIIIALTQGQENKSLTRYMQQRKPKTRHQCTMAFSAVRPRQKSTFAGNRPMCEEVKDFLRIAPIFVLTTKNRSLLQTMSLSSSLHSTGDYNVGRITHSPCFSNWNTPLSPVQKPTGTYRMVYNPSTMMSTLMSTTKSKCSAADWDG